MKGKSSRRPKTTEGSAQKSGWSKLLKPSIVKWPATPQVSQKMRKRWIYIELITMFEWFRYCDVKPKRGRQSAMLPQGERENYWKSNRPNQNSPLQTNSFNLLMSRGGICPCRHCRRQCKIFASGVNFSTLTHFLCFFSTKTVEIRWFLAWKSGGVNFWTNSMSES